MFVFDQQHRRLHLLSYGLGELLGLFWVHSVHRRHISSSWRGGRLTAGSILCCRLRAETDMLRFEGVLMVIISRDYFLSDNNAHHSKR